MLLRSVGFALATVALCLLLGYPVAYYIARFGGRYKHVLIALVVLPFFVNYLVRTYAWVAILSDEGRAQRPARRPRPRARCGSSTRRGR